MLEIRDLWPDSVNGLKHINISLFMPLLKYLEKKMYNSADKIVINNEAFRSHIQKRLQRKVPIFYLPNGISRNELITEEKYNDFSVIYTGNIGYAQDVDKLISICLALNDKQINVTAIVYGVQADKFRKAVRDCKYIQVKKPMDRTACLSEISKHHISLSILESSDVFMNVMPGKIVDAIGVGTPPISNISGPTEAIIQKYNLGFARKQVSIDTIVNEIESLKYDEQALSIKARNACEYRDEHLIWEDNIEKLMTFLRKGDRDDKTYKIKCENVSKVYDLNVNRKDKLLSLFTFGLSYKSKPYYALHDISFEVEEGTSVGIIGLNGSGKSTLSNILGGVVEPSSGTVYTNGKPSLIAIGAGLNPEFTGEENIHYKCLMHGMTQREINEKFDDIVQFSELDEFIYQPLKSYSSGMKSRLGFAIAIHTDPDILIVDEALSVGDETFSNKCIDKMHDLQEQGKTIFLYLIQQDKLKMCKKLFGYITVRW